MMRTVLAASALCLSVPALAADGSMAYETAEVEKAKKPKKIKDRRHPDYVRCRSEPIIGSLARKRRICMTNSEWAEYGRKGNENARRFVDGQQAGMDQSN